MVWWMHNSPERRREGTFFGLHTETDRVLQTINIMYDCHDLNYDAYDILSLIKVGVNIFHVDMIRYDGNFFENISNAVDDSYHIPVTHPSAYYAPVGLAVTMSAMDPIEIDDAVDIVILKDIMKTNQLREFKKRNKKIASVPILFWPPSLQIEDLNELIKISDGIVLDPSLSDIFYGFKHVLGRTKEARKPVFFMNPTIIENYYDDKANDRQLLIQVHNIVNSRLDGVFLLDNREKPPLEMLQAFVRTTELIEKEFHVASKEYSKLSVSVPVPVLQPYAVALGASLAALQCQAAVILVFTTTGASARILSCAAPPCPIIAITRYKRSTRRMHLYRKVIPLHYHEKRAASWQDESLARIKFGTQFGLDNGLFNFTAKLVVLAPSEEGVMYCNSFQIVTVSRIVNASTCKKRKKFEIIL